MLFFKGDIDLNAAEIEPLDVIVAPTGLNTVLVNGQPMPTALGTTQTSVNTAATAAVVSPTGLNGVLVNGRAMPIALASTEQDARLAQAGAAGSSTGVGTGVEIYKDKEGDDAFTSTIDVQGNRTVVYAP